MLKRERPERVARRIAKTLVMSYRPERVILFGSRSEGTARHDSDIDLLIIKKTAQPFYQRLADVRRLVSEERRGYAFEPIVLTPTEVRKRLAMGDQFLQQIIDRGHVLYAGK